MTAHGVHHHIWLSLKAEFTPPEAGGQETIDIAVKVLGEGHVLLPQVIARDYLPVVIGPLASGTAVVVAFPAVILETRVPTAEAMFL